jgi:hypothetical protein
METILRFLENAIRLRNLAAAESDPTLRAQLEKQSLEYRALAQRRAEKRNLPVPGEKDSR